MADIKPTLDAIDEAIEGYVTWSGYSPDAMQWSAEEERGGGGVYYAPCPICGTPIESITRGRTYADGPFQPVTYLPCGCQPGARAQEGLATGGLIRPSRNPFWMLEAPPTQYFVTPHFEPGEITHVSISGVDVTDMVRTVTLDNREATFAPTGIITTAPEPPSGGDALSNLRAAYQRIAELDRPQRTVVAAPDMASRIEGLGIDVVESPLVPEGQVYVINQPPIGPMFSEPMSYSFDRDVATYRLGMRFTQPTSFTYSGTFDTCSDVGKELDKLMRWVNRAERIKQLHRAYRHRCLARRRRNR